MLAFFQTSSCMPSFIDNYRCFHSFLRDIPFPDYVPTKYKIFKKIRYHIFQSQLYQISPLSCGQDNALVLKVGQIDTAKYLMFNMPYSCHNIRFSLFIFLLPKYFVILKYFSGPTLENADNSFSQMLHKIMFDTQNALGYIAC